MPSAFRNTRLVLQSLPQPFPSPTPVGISDQSLAASLLRTAGLSNTCRPAPPFFNISDCSSMFQAILRQSFFFLVVFAIGIGLTVLTLVYAPRKYQSQTKLMVGLGRENVVLDPTATIGETANFHRTPDFEIESTIQTMLSRDVIEKVVQRIGVDRVLKKNEEGLQDLQAGGPGFNPGEWIDWLVQLQYQMDPVAPREQAINRLFKGMTVEARRNSGVIDVRFLASTPELAQEITQTWLDVFRSEHSSRSATKESLAFFESVEKNLSEQLNRAREEFQARKTSFGLVTTGGGQRILEQQLELAKTSRIQTTLRLANSKSRLESLLKQEEATDRYVMTADSTAHTSDAQQRMRTSLYQLEIQLEALASKYGPEHPQYINLQRQVDEARTIYEAQKEGTRQTVETLNPLFVHLLEQIANEQSSFDGFAGELGSVEETVALLTKQLESLNQQETELATLERRVEVLENQYRLQYIKLEQARLAQQLEATDISNLKIVQKPSFEEKPASPNLLICAILGAFASLMGAIGLASVRESNYHSNISQQNSTTGEPRLSVAAIREQRRREAREKRKTSSAAAASNPRAIRRNENGSAQSEILHEEKVV